jgi:hypothetical protein
MTFPRFDPHDVLESAGRVADAALGTVPPALLESSGTSQVLEVDVLMDRDAPWQLAHFVLDALGTQFSDRLGSFALPAPAGIDGRVLLRMQVAVPAAAADALKPAIQDAAEAAIRGVLGPDVELMIAVGDPLEAD